MDPKVIILYCCLLAQKVGPVINQRRELGSNEMCDNTIARCIVLASAPPKMKQARLQVKNVNARVTTGHNPPAMLQV